MEVKTSEFFKNIKRLPPPGTAEFQQLIDWEVEKCMGGITVNGVFISGWLYWHTNHWKIRIDKLDNHGNIVREEALPELRDNEWIRAEHLEACKQAKLGYIEVGARQTGKSEAEASICGYHSVLFRNTQNVIVGGSDDDIALLKDKVDFGLKNVWEGIYIPRLDKTWRKNTIRLGYKDSKGDDEVWSYIIIRNVRDGHNTEGPAGVTAKSFVMDEIGKFSFAPAYEAAKPAFMSKFGMRAVPMLVGTGGAFEKGENAQRFFYNPEANGFLPVTDPLTGKKTGLFLSGIYRQDCKNLTTLADWLIKERGISAEDVSELEKIQFFEADKELATNKIEEERELKKKDPDQSEYLKVIMYHPLTPDECFMRNATGIFNITSATKQKRRIIDNNITSSRLFLEYDGETIVPQMTEKLPINEFPHNKNSDLDAPIQVWEHPVPNPPFGLYVAGVDPYRHTSAKHSSSLGAVYIYKRIHDISGEGWQNRFVASYVARPDDKEKWNSQARLLIKWYNARTICENDEMSFIEYMKNKGDAMYLEKQPPWLKEVVPTTSVSREYGIHSSDKIIEYRDSMLKKYTEDIMLKETDDKGSVIKEVPGMHYIPDSMLLEEMIKHDPSDKDFNADRIVAAGLALTLSAHLDPILIPSGKLDPRMKAYMDRSNKTSRTLFNDTRKTLRSAKSSVKKLFK